MEPLTDVQLDNVQLNMYRDMRIAHDLSHVRLRDVADSSDNWIVAEIVPAELSGRAHVFGAHLNIETGEMVADQGHPEIRIVSEGKWRLKEKLTKPRSRLGTFQPYEWSQPQNVMKREISIEELFPVFHDRCGGHIICVHNPKGSGAEKFASVTLIPDEWQYQVKPALAFLSKNQTKLKDLARASLDTDTFVGTNPFVAISLVQELNDEQVQTETLAKAFLARFRGHAQATIACSLARQSLTEMRGPLADCVRHATSPVDIVGIMTGLRALAWIGFRGVDSDSLQTMTNTLQEIRDRVKQRYPSIKDNSEASSALGALLDSFGTE
jgi:hypothetical protein